MKYFFIDTNNFISCALLQEASHGPETIDKLSEVLASNKTKLLLPEVVEIEFFREVDTNYYSIEKAVKSLTKNLSDNFPSLLNKDKDDFIRSAHDILKKRNDAKIIAKPKIKSLFNCKNVIRIHLNSEIFINAFKRAIAGKKPYKYSYCAECKELKNVINSDCLIFESLLYKLRELNEKAELIFCNNNIEHFAEYDEKKKTHILNHELRDDLPNGTSVKYYRHFAVALNFEFSAKIKKADIQEITNISDSISKIGKAFSESRGPFLKELQNIISPTVFDNIIHPIMPSLNPSILNQMKLYSDSGLDQLRDSLSSAILDSIKNFQQSGLLDESKRVQESGILGRIRKINDSGIEGTIKRVKKADQQKKADDDNKDKK